MYERAIWVVLWSYGLITTELQKSEPYGFLFLGTKIMWFSDNMCLSPGPLPQGTQKF